MDREEQLAKEYANSNFENVAYHYTDDKRLTDFDKVKKSFKAGYTAAKIEWNKVEDKLPDTDRRVLVWLEDTKVPHWSGYRIGAYLNESWYLDGGRASHEIVTQWYDFPDVEI